MSNNAINTALFRPLKSGNNYNNLFPKVDCKPTFLGEGNTSFTLDQMKLWSIKYVNQTKGVSDKLKGKTVAETITNIYNFLHDHLQYQADGFEQNLRSPACSWSTRKIGIDCKSYSLFASTILLNLNIPHSFRKIIQPSTPGKWTHVYVVIPYKNRELIIDGTLHYNSEVSYLKKEDLPMPQLPHFGLNAPVSVPEKDLKVVQAVQNFVIFLDDLNKKGIPKETTEQIKSLVKNSLDQGIDPKISFVNNGIKINNTLLPLTNGLNMPIGLGFWGAALSAITGGGSGKDSKSSGIGGIFKGLFSNVFGGSPLAHFTKLANNLGNRALPGIQAKYASNPAKMLTEMHKAISYVIMTYDAALSDCSSSCSKNQAGKEIAQTELATFNDNINKISRDHELTYENKSMSFPMSYLSEYDMKGFSKHRQANYREYEIVAKNNPFVIDQGGVNINDRITNIDSGAKPKTNGGDNNDKPDNTILYLGAGTLALAGIYLMTNNNKNNNKN